MLIAAQPDPLELRRLTAHQKHLLITNVYWRRPAVLVGVVRSLEAIADRHRESI